MIKQLQRVALINPPLTMADRYGKHLRGGGSYLPPYGLAILGAVLRNAGHTVMILDCEVLQMEYGQACKEIFKFKPDIVGFTAVTASIYNAAKLAGMIKEIDKDIPIILGGAHVSAAAFKTMLKFPQFNISVDGEGENAILKIINNEYYFNHYEFDPVEDLDTIPFPAFDLLPMDKYKPSPIYFKDYPQGMIMSSRGCYGKCTFCDNSVSGNNMRFHSAEYVVNLMKYLRDRFNIKEIIFHDDIFAVNKRRLYEICYLIRSRDLKMSWQANARIDSVNLDMLKEMKKAGCWLVAYGIESGSQKILNTIRKGFKIEEVKQTLEWTKLAGLKAKGYFMLGNIGETEKTLQETEKFILDIPLDILALNIFTPFPNTVDYKRASQYGKFNNNWRLLNQHSIVFIPNGLTAELLELTSQRIQRRFYLRIKKILYFVGKLSSLRKTIIVVRGFFTFLFYICRRKK